jgi:hypothetical protein
MLKNADTAPWYRHRWPWLLMAGPFAVVVAASATAWIAYTRQDALVVDDYYKQGKAINQDLRRDRLAAAMQLTADLRYDPAAGCLIGKLDSPVRPVAGTLVVRLVHSTLPEKDVRLLVQPEADGSFAAKLGMLEQARWQVIVENEKGDWRLAGEWDWPKQHAMSFRATLPPADD